jgi:hypothetical protein
VPQFVLADMSLPEVEAALANAANHGQQATGTLDDALLRVASRIDAAALWDAAFAKARGARAGGDPPPSNRTNG